MGRIISVIIPSLILIIGVPFVYGVYTHECQRVAGEQPDGATPAQAAAATPDEVRTWPTLDLGGKHHCRATLRTRWLEGRVYYQFSIGPVAASAVEYNFLGVKRFDLHFYDNERFDLGMVEARLEDMQKTQTSASVPGQFVTLAANSSSPLEQAVYERATQWNIGTNIGVTEPPRPVTE
jgi:hypothetical protein